MSMQIEATPCAGQPDRTSVAVELAGNYLTCQLAGQDYGIPILKIADIIKILRGLSVISVHQNNQGE